MLYGVRIIVSRRPATVLVYNPRGLRSPEIARMTVSFVPGHQIQPDVARTYISEGFSDCFVRSPLPIRIETIKDPVDGQVQHGPISV